MTDDREVFKVRREAGLQKRHEKRLESATYTAAEVKVLTEAALRLGRREAGEALMRLENEFRILSDPSYAHKTGATAWREAYKHAHECVLQEQQALKGEDLMGYALPDTTSGRTDPEEGAKLPNPDDRTAGERQNLLRIPTHDIDGNRIPEWEREYLARDIGKGDPTT